MTLDQFKTLAEGIGALMTALAVLGAGIWALRRYVFEKESFPRIEFFVDADFVGIHQKEWVVEILGLLKNVGSVPHRIHRLDFSVRALSEADALQDGNEIRGQLLFPHVVKKGSWTPADTAMPMVIIPGVNLRYSYQYHVPVSTAFLLIEGRLYYQEHSRLEHRADKVVRVPRKGEIRKPDFVR
jgi:hypothetical protein